MPSPGLLAGMPSLFSEYQRLILKPSPGAVLSPACSDAERAIPSILEEERQPGKTRR
jgi:hypothetical protein